MDTNSESKIIYEAPALTWQSEPRFRIPGVVYRGKQGNYLLFEQMTSSMTQDSLIELYESEKAKGNPVPTDMPLIWAIATKGFELKDKNPEAAEKLRHLLRQGFRKWSTTLTRVHYSPQDDCIVHNIGTSDQYTLEGNVVGPNGFVNEIPDNGVLEKLLGTRNISQINLVSQWINGTKSYIWRLNSKPKQLDKLVARFGADVDGLVLGCSRDPLYEDPAFRVLRVD